MTTVTQTPDKQQGLLEFLIAKHALSSETAATIQKASAESSKSIDELVIEQNVINIEDYTRIKADFFHFPYIDLSDKSIDEDTINIIPISIAEHYKIIAFEKADKRLKVGLVDATNFKAIEAMDFLAQKNKLKVDYFLISSFSFNSAFSQYKNFSKEIEGALAVKAKEDLVKKEEIAARLDDDTKNDGVIKDAPVSKIVSVIIRHAIEGERVIFILNQCRMSVGFAIVLMVFYTPR